MHANIRFLCPEFFPLVPNGTYECPEGSTVQEFVERCVADFGTPLQNDWSNKVVLMKDNKPASKDEMVTDGSDILVLRRVLSG